MQNSKSFVKWLTFPGRFGPKAAHNQFSYISHFCIAGQSFVLSVPPRCRITKSRGSVKHNNSLKYLHNDKIIIAQSNLLLDKGREFKANGNGHDDDGALITPTHSPPPATGHVDPGPINIQLGHAQVS